MPINSGETPPQTPNVKPDKSLTEQEEELLAKWQLNNAKQRARFAALDQKGRAAWGIEPKEELEEKQERDERENPSTKPTPQE